MDDGGDNLGNNKYKIMAPAAVRWEQGEMGGSGGYPKDRGIGFAGLKAP